MAAPTPPDIMPAMTTTPETGAQRLPIADLQRFEALGYGMFIHFGMSTFDQEEMSKGDRPSTFYAPDKLDVDGWVSLARDAGMKYAVLTTKHVSGHCLWPTRLNDYHVGTSGNTTNVVEAFVRACQRCGVMPGFYYCSWDNHNRFGSCTANFSPEGVSGAFWEHQFTTTEYENFQTGQLEELLGGAYGAIGEVWIDIPYALSHGYRRRLYNRIAEMQPKTIIVMNNGIGDGTKINPGAWPSDVVPIETMLPPVSAVPGSTSNGHQPWREIMGKRHYIPGEICDTVSRRWFWTEGDKPKSDRELLGLAMIAKARGCNFLLDIGPDRSGRVDPAQRDALMRLRRNLDKLGDIS
jgi:alpha-L-fucosidase